MELASSDAKVIDVAMKYGYESPDSFTKAFQRFHGILPSQARSNGSHLRSFSRLVLKFSLEGGTIMNYRIETKPALMLYGHQVICGGSPTNPDNVYNATKKHWMSCRAEQTHLKEIRGNTPVWYDVYSNISSDAFTHMIAVDAHAQDPFADMCMVTIPSHLYAIFETNRCESPDDEWLPLMRRIVGEWLPTTEYVLSNHPQINKLYFEEDCSKRYMEIWIPVEKAN